MEAVRQYGDVVLFETGPWSLYFVNHPDYLKHILQDNSQNYRRSVFLNLLKPLVGQGLLTSDGKLWNRQRRLAQSAFHQARIEALATIMTDVTASMLNRWRSYTASGQSLDIGPEMRRLTLEIVGKTLFGVGLGDKADTIDRALTIAFEHINYRSIGILTLPESIPTPQNFRFWQAVSTLNKIVYEIIDRRQDEGEIGEDFLSILLFSRDEDTGEGISRQQAHDAIMTFILAGHETTASALAWTWYLLAQHPKVEQDLRTEVIQVLGGRIPIVSDIPRLAYTRKVIQEVLRLYPPVWGLSRTTRREDKIGGYHIPANSSVVSSTYVLHRHPNFWDAPDVFDPERFSPERFVGKHPYAYIPFGAGPRRCIGDRFAMMELQLIIPLVIQHYHLRPVPGYRVELHPLFSLRPRHGMPMTLHPV